MLRIQKNYQQHKNLEWHMYELSASIFVCMINEHNKEKTQETQYIFPSQDDKKPVLLHLDA